MRVPGWVVIGFLPVISVVALRAQQAAPTTAEARAIAFLAKEVPAWHAEHRCYSCHNNGDAARALVQASRSGFDTASPLADTLAFLSLPPDWEKNSRGGGLDDTALARIQFAGALTSAIEAKLLARDALAPAAKLVASDQKPNGSWQLDPSNSLGSPTTYGTPLATWAARRALVAADASGYRAQIEKAEAWMRALKPRDTPDLAAVTLTFPAGPEADRIERALIDLQGPDGGWGPFPNVRSEPFDTAIAVLALRSRAVTSGRSAAIARGLDYLRSSIGDDGSWVETTRPAGQRSYAQRLSTTGWAVLALLSGSDGRRPGSLHTKAASNHRIGLVVDALELVDFK